MGGVILVDQTALDEAAQDTGSHARLHVGKRRRVKVVGGMESGRLGASSGARAGSKTPSMT